MVQVKRPSLITRKLAIVPPSEASPPMNSSDGSRNPLADRKTAHMPAITAADGDGGTQRTTPPLIEGIRQRAERHRAQQAGYSSHQGHAFPPFATASPLIPERAFAQLGAVHAPTLHERTGPQETIGRPRPYELTCELCPPGFVVEDVLEMFLAAYRRHRGEKPRHLYIHWHQLLDLMARTGSCLYNGIPVHVKRGLGFWTVMGTNYALSEEQVR